MSVWSRYAMTTLERLLCGREGAAPRWPRLSAALVAAAAGLWVLDGLLGGGLSALLLNTSSVPGGAAGGGAGAGAAAGASGQGGPGAAGAPESSGPGKSEPPWWKKEYEDVRDGVQEFWRDVKQTGDDIRDDVVHDLARDIQQGREHTRQQQQEEPRKHLTGEDK